MHIPLVGTKRVRPHVALAGLVTLLAGLVAPMATLPASRDPRPAESW